MAIHGVEEGKLLNACQLKGEIADDSDRHTLIPPRGYSIAGVSGSCGQWVDGFSLIIKR